jgi:hypothetical protein
MSRRNPVALKAGLIRMTMLGIGIALLSGVGSLDSVVPIVAADQDAGREVETHDTEGLMQNPHSDLIFRATGATSCRDCHRVGKSGGLTPPADRQ